MTYTIRIQAGTRLYSDTVLCARRGFGVRSG